MMNSNACNGFQNFGVVRKFARKIAFVSLAVMSAMLVSVAASAGSPYDRDGWLHYGDSASVEVDYGVLEGIPADQPTVIILRAPKGMNPKASGGGQQPIFAPLSPIAPANLLASEGVAGGNGNGIRGGIVPTGNPAPPRSPLAPKGMSPSAKLFGNIPTNAVDMASNSASGIETSAGGLYVGTPEQPITRRPSQPTALVPNNVARKPNIQQPAKSVSEKAIAAKGNSNTSLAEKSFPIKTSDAAKSTIKASAPSAIAKSAATLKSAEAAEAAKAPIQVASLAPSAAPAPEAITANTTTEANVTSKDQVKLPPEATAKVAEAAKQIVVFSGDATDVTADQKQIIEKSVSSALKNPSQRVTLKSYATGDGNGTARRVSLSRALAVRSYLMDLGISGNRIDVRALGNTEQSSGQPSDRIELDVAG